MHDQHLRPGCQRVTACCQLHKNWGNILAMLLFSVSAKCHRVYRFHNFLIHGFQQTWYASVKWKAGYILKCFFFFFLMLKTAIFSASLFLHMRLALQSFPVFWKALNRSKPLNLGWNELHAYAILIGSIGLNWMLWVIWAHYRDTEVNLSSSCFCLHCVDWLK